jgi:hypothetical protein
MKDTQDEYGICFLNASDYEWKLSKSCLSNPQVRNNCILHTFPQTGNTTLAFVNPGKKFVAEPQSLRFKTKTGLENVRLCAMQSNEPALHLDPRNLASVLPIQFQPWDSLHTQRAAFQNAMMLVIDCFIVVAAVPNPRGQFNPIHYGHGENVWGQICLAHGDFPIGQMGLHFQTSFESTKVGK